MGFDQLGAVVSGLPFVLGIVAAALWDIRARRVPNALNLGYGLLGVAVTAFWDQRGLMDPLLGLLVGFGIILVPLALRLYRGGDAKLVIALGAWLGPVGILWAFGFGVVLGGVLGVLMVLGDPETRRAVTESVKASALTKTTPVVAERDTRRHVPMAVAFGAGAIIARFWF